MIYLIAHYDFSFDRFEPAGSRIFRVVTESSDQGHINHNRGVPGPLGQVIRKELAGVEEITSFDHYDNNKVAASAGPHDQPRSFKGRDLAIIADQNYFSLIPYEWLSGSPQTALTQPGRVVLNATTAGLYFPGLAYSDIVGRKVIYDDTVVTTVAGVVADLDRKGNTDFSYTEFISLPTVADNKSLRDEYNLDNWGNLSSDHQVFVRLAKSARPAAVEAGLVRLYDKYKRGADQKNGGKDTWLLQPLKDIHFNGDYGTLNADYGTGQVASLPILYGLMTVAAFLLLLGCINFVNLTTAQAVQRAKEIGIRKAMGSSRWQLISQFLCETFIITLGATVLSMAVTPFLLETFSDFIPKGVHFLPVNPMFWYSGRSWSVSLAFWQAFTPPLCFLPGVRCRC